MYYREDIFAELGLSEPETWEQEVANWPGHRRLGPALLCHRQPVPVACGRLVSDYLNMRTNGFDFHMELARGEIAWTDDRVRATFANWRTLIRHGRLQSPTTRPTTGRRRCR